MEKKYSIYSLVNNTNYITKNKTIIKSEIYKNKELAVGYSIKKDDLKKIYKGANDAFKEWKDSPIDFRIKIMQEWSRNIEQNIHTIAKYMTYEIGKNYADSVSEIRRSIDFIHDTIESFKSLKLEAYNEYNSSGEKIAIYKQVPLGVILCIAPFNYPINLSISKVVPALLTGNTVIVKSSSNATICSYLLYKELCNTEIKKGVFNYIIGKGSDIGDFIVNKKYTKLINYTGSTKVGKKIASSGEFCNYILEMGGNCPAVILNDADYKEAANQIVKGAFSYNGQRCTAIKRVIIEKNISKKFITYLKSKVKDLTIGMPHENTYITPMINRSSYLFAKELLEKAINNKDKIIIGNKFDDTKNIINPTIVIVKNNKEDIFIKEQFAPILPILVINNNTSNEEIINIINDSEYGLQTSIYTTDLNKALFLANKTETGTININGVCQRGPDYLPFLGVKGSGLNPQGIKKTLLSCLRLRGIIINIKY